MKKTAIAIAVALAGVVTVARAQTAPEDSFWYLGSKLGWSQYHDTGFYGNNFPELTGDVSVRKDQLGAGAFLGYQSNRYLGFEIGYDWLGRMPYKGNVDNGAFKAQGIQVSAKLGYPISPDVDVYGRIGGLVWRADAKASYDNGLSQIRKHDTGISPLFAGGVEWAITPNLASRVEYQWVNNIGDANSTGARPDNGQLSAGISYRFGTTPPAPAPVVQAPVPAPEPQVQNKQFTLKSDVLFDFNKATLKSQGQQALNELYDELSNIDPNSGTVTVTGYTDRIGSEAYNQNLSEQRAASVQEYLIQRGIPANGISSRGMGKANPVTGQQCDSVKGRNQLIVCLAPDRRVEIDVQGIKQEVIN